ncbi:MAG: hypothetical protein COA73_02640 [Candidatus Hydrogenedentota bacterium]|nr:MAG: hypothetical protein COA73_02640 [Candidatus Hydrogenedentota bacterium]
MCREGKNQAANIRIRGHSMPINPKPASHTIEVNDINIHYLESGDANDEVALMLHGWPTSAHLWRNILPIVGEKKRAIAIDLPGYGLSDKPPDTRYSFIYYEKILEGFMEEMGITKIDLVVHDLGGPVGIFWALRHPEKVRSLVLLNTLVYPEMSWAVKVFGLAIRLPLIRNWMASPAGMRFSLKFGVYNKQNITQEVMKGYQDPFQTKEARTGLLKGGQGLSMKGFHEIAEKLSQYKGPIQLIYGENDRILPDVAQTMQRVKDELPQAKIIPIPNCGHFLQEDDPEAIAVMLNTFYTNNE